MPLISIVLPTYNRAYCLERAVRSVVTQDFEDWELLLVDDGSTDETPQLRERFARLLGPRYREITGHRRGASAARNLGVSAAHGEFIAFLDSDDFWFPEKLGIQLNRLRQDEGTGWSFTDFCTFDEAGRFFIKEHDVPIEQHKIPVALERRPYPSLLEIRNNVVMTPTVLARRDILIASHGFDESMRVCEDIDLWLRMSRHTRVVAIRQPLTAVHVRKSEAFQYSTGISARTALYAKAVAADPALDPVFVHQLFDELISDYKGLARDKADQRTEEVLASVLNRLNSGPRPLPIQQLCEATMSVVGALDAAQSPIAV